MRRETFSSLKAVHGARRVAAGYLYRDAIDPMEMNCPSCGADLNGKSVRWAGHSTVECPACGTAVPLPPHVVAEIQRVEAARDAWQPDAPSRPPRGPSARFVLLTTLTICAALALGLLLYIVFQLVPHMPPSNGR